MQAAKGGTYKPLSLRVNSKPSADDEPMDTDVEPPVNNNQVSTQQLDISSSCVCFAQRKCFVLHLF